MPHHDPGAPSLRDLQRWLRWILTDPRGVGPALDGRYPEASHYPEPTARHLDCVLEQPPLDRVRRLDVYAEGYHWRIRDALAEDFPTVARALGEERFDRLVAEYLRSNPSTYFNIAEVGSRLPEFLAAHSFAVELPWLSGMATLDWLVQESFYADDMPALDRGTLASIAPHEWPDVHFTLDAAVRLLGAEWELDTAWGEKTPPAALARGPVCLCVHRIDGEVYVDRITPTQLAALDAMRAGATLGALGDELPARLGESEAHVLGEVRESFAQWMETGIIRGVHAPDRGR